MTDQIETVKVEFIYPLGNYQCEFSLEHLAFNANLQELAHKVSYFYGLESNGKLIGIEAYKDIKKLCKKLKVSKKQLLDGSEIK